MRIGIMQPYFFPYLGYFALIAHVDEWVIFDITQYTPRTWVNRNRILHPDKGWIYISVPLANSSQSIRIFEAEILDIHKAHTTVLGKISHYNRRAPYFRRVHEIVDSVFKDTKNLSLVDLNIRTLKATCEYLGIPFQYKVCSKLDLTLPGSMHPGGWAPAISSLLGADEYVNPIGGRELFDPLEFRDIGVGLNFLTPPDFVYDTSPYEFHPQMSIIDVLMWNSPESILDAIHGAQLTRVV